jgi:hypothetical protein
MPRRQDVPPAIYRVLIDFHRRLRLYGAATSEMRMTWYREVEANIGKRAADLAWALMEANITPSQINQYFVGENTVPQNNNPGGTNINQTAGGNQTGVNATGRQTIGDITTYSQDLDQAGASISPQLRTALIEARKTIDEENVIDPAMKPTIIEHFDKLTAELKKGDQKSPGVASMLWGMIYGAVKAVPTAVAAIAALDKLRIVLGY